MVKPFLPWPPYHVASPKGQFQDPHCCQFTSFSWVMLSATIMKIITAMWTILTFMCPLDNLANVLSCLSDIKCWMSQNVQYANIIPAIQSNLGGLTSHVKPSAHNLGVIFDSNLGYLLRAKLQKFICPLFWS